MGGGGGLLLLDDDRWIGGFNLEVVCGYQNSITRISFTSLILEPAVN